MNSFSTFEELYEKDIEMKEKLQECNNLGEITKFIANKDKIKDRNGFIKSLVEYKNLHDLSLYYEYLGAMLRCRKVDEKTYFDIFSFPDAFWFDTHEIREFLIQIKYSDFWDNFIWLHNFYFHKRLKNGLEPTYNNYKETRTFEKRKIKEPIRFHADIVAKLKLNSQISKRLNVIRKSKTLECAHIAKAIKISREEYIKYETVSEERDATDKDIEILSKICVHMHITIRDLFPDI